MNQGAPAALRLALCSPGEIWGGVEQFVESLARCLAERGVPVFALVFSDGTLRRRLQLAGVPVTVIGGRGRYDPSAIARVRACLRENGINVLHTHGYKAAVIGGIAARATGVRHVRTEHGRVEPWAGTARLKMELNAWLERASSRLLTDAIVYVTRDIQQTSKNASPAVIQEVVYNGIEPRPAPGAIPHSDRLPDGATLNVGIVGRISPVKGHLRLLQAVERLRHLKELRVYVLGSGPLEDECRRYCAEKGLADVVTFLGFKPNIHDYFRQLHVLAMPSLHEGLPYSLLEAMFHQVAVVASAVGGLPEVLEHNVTGLLVPSGDVAALAQAIERLALDPDLSRTLARNAHREVCERFLVDRMADRYVDVYNRLLMPQT